MQSPGPDRDPAVIVMLADAYQACDNHQDALWWYRIAVEASPRLARDRKLRKRIKRSEAALGRTQSLVGEVPGARRRRLTWVVAAIGLVAIALLVNHFAASRQTLHLLGEGLKHHRAAFDHREGVVLLAPDYWLPNAAGVHRCAWRRAQAGLFSKPDQLLPFYLRRPEAVERWEKLHPEDA